MKIELQIKGNSFLLNGKQYQKGTLSVDYRVPNVIYFGHIKTTLADVTADGETFGTIEELENWTGSNLFKSGGSTGGNGGSDNLTIQQTITNGNVLTKGLKLNNPDSSQVIDIGGKWSGTNENEESKIYVKEGRIALYSERFVNNAISTQLITGSKLANIKADFSSNDKTETDFGFDDNGVLHVRSKVKKAAGNVNTDYEYSFPIKHGTDREVVCWDGNGNMKAMRLGWKQFSDLPSVPPFTNGVLAGTAFQPNGNALFAFIELATEGAKQAAIPLYKSNGRMSVGRATEADDAIQLGQINGYFMAIQGYIEGASQTLTHVDGKLKWV